MAELSITASAVVAAAGSSVKVGTAGEAITAGDALYIDSSDSNSLKLAQHDGTEAQALFAGVALADAADGQPVSYCPQGSITVNAVLTAGSVYGLGATAGSIADLADAGASDYVSVIGVALSTTVLKVAPIISGVTI